MKKYLILVVWMVSLFGCFSGSSRQDTADSGQQDKSAVKAKINVNDDGILVKTKTLAYERFEHYVEVSGSIEAVKEAFVSSETNGQIKEILVKEGDRVNQGDLVMVLNSSIIESSIEEVETALRLAAVVYEKRRGLWEKQIGSEIQYLEAKTNKESLENKLKTLRAQLALSSIKAPISGIVDQIAKKEGELAIPGQLLLQIINLKKVYINADVSEAYLSKIKKGDMVLITFSSYPGYTAKTSVQRIGHVINPQNRTFKIQMLLDNADEQLKPNIMAGVQIMINSLEQALVIPSLIVKNDLQGKYIYISAKKDNRLIAKKVYIKTSISNNNQTVVSSGVNAKDQIIVEGYNLVKDGIRIRMESL
jgi:RND family efflux transporter MFP subunit